MITVERAIAHAEPNGSTPAPGDVLEAVRHLGRLLDDLERVRIMNGNRIGALERAHGDALPHLHFTSEQLAGVEHAAELELVRMWRKHPLAAWAKAQRGVGEKSIARLIAEIGDPAVGSTGHWASNGGQRSSEDQAPHAPVDREWVIDGHFDRSLHQLWQFCGLGRPGRLPAGALQSELLARGKPRAKKQLFLIATAMLKTGNRDVYDARREATAERVHTADCAPCKAKAGEPWKAGHQHADALRIVGKEFLRDLWVEARRLR